MYRINQQTNSIQKIEETTFKEIGASERNHLQEWIAKNPEVLCGEDESLLIIQKEFDGFNDTRERLDLLALDNNGNLVIIENKLDDSGRDVTWQGLKYVSYCASLNTEQIIDIYDAYLSSDEESAAQNIKEFLGLESEEELLLNDGDQRLILVAHRFRKEVTSTVMWLLEKDIKIQCFKAVPYKMGNENLLQLEQIIPLPETQEYVISLQAKEKQQKAKTKSLSERQMNVIGFWNEFKVSMRESGFMGFEQVTPSANTYYGFGVGRGRYVCCFGRDGFRVELVFLVDDDNSQLEALERFKDEIENRFSKPLVWEKPTDKRFSKVQYTHPYSLVKQQFQQANGRPMQHWRDGKDWDIRIEVFKQYIVELYDVIQPYYDKVRNN